MNINKKIEKNKLIGIISGVLVGICLTLPLIFLNGEKDNSLNLKYTSLSTTQGNSLLPVASPENPLVPVQKIKVVVTAYSSTIAQTDSTPFITASGSSVKDGIVANNLLPFGTKIRIPEIYGDRVFVVEDRMNWRKGYYHVDIWFPEYWQAKEFGAKNLYIEILEG